MYTPLVSVIIPTFNSEKFIGECLNSVISQTYKRIEIIIIDNGSTDNTEREVDKFSGCGFRIIKTTASMLNSPAAARNKGIQSASGELIAFLDSDDRWHKNKLEEQIPYFEVDPELIFVYSMSITTGEAGFLSEYYELLPLPFRAARCRDELISIGNTIPLSSVVTRTDALKRAGGFDEDPELKIEDYDLWLRLSESGNFRFIPAVHVYYRIHPHQFSSDWQTRQERIRYLAKKRNLDLPVYRYIRKRGFLFLLIRNTVHLSCYLFFSGLNSFKRIIRKLGKKLG
ncbi:MAG: hypothetical protein Kow0098_22040 [Ignavibacteriaceae bacterium]